MIGILDYGVGNLASVFNAFSKFRECIILQDPNSPVDLSGIVLPGVGNFKSAILRAYEFRDLIGDVPTLGICLGMQLMLEESCEGNAPGLGLIPGRALKLPTRITPQIGWYPVEIIDPKCPILKDLPKRSMFYFAHSYYASPSDPSTIKAMTIYNEFRAPGVIQSGNLYGVQFHPEKSGELGMKLIRNFCELC